MLPGVNPRQMQQMMRRMGINQTEIDATQVIIQTPTKRIYIDSPQVSKVNMMGQETYQVVGAARVEEIESEITINEDDVATVVAQAGVSEDEATEAIKASKGDLAAAILSLKRD